MIYRVVTATVLMSFSLATAPIASAQAGFGQSFTVPDSPNTFLTAISATGLSGNSESDPFLAQIFGFNGSAIIGDAVFSQSLGTSFNGFSLEPNLNLDAGATYLLLASRGFGAATGVSGAASFYEGGSAQLCFTGSCFSAFATGTEDVEGFSLNFTTPATTVPEPSTYALLASGLALLGMATVRRKRVG